MKYQTKVHSSFEFLDLYFLLVQAGLILCDFVQLKIYTPFEFMQ